MFWINRAGDKTIEKSWTNGHDLETLVTEDLVEPTSLAVDPHQDHRVFWCDIRKGTIESVNYDGSDRTVIFATPEDQHPFYMDVFGE